jgi:hypothetical protein
MTYFGKKGHGDSFIWSNCVFKIEFPISSLAETVLHPNDATAFEIIPVRKQSCKYSSTHK